MNKKDEVKFSMTMKALGEAFQKEVSPLKIEIYFKALQDLSIEALEQACWNMINTRVLTGTFPMVAEIRNAIQGNPEQKALIALEKLEHVMRSKGCHYTVVFDDPIVHHVVQNLHKDGWIGICSLDDSEWKWVRKEFLDKYKAAASIDPKAIEVPLELCGIYDYEHTFMEKKEYLFLFGERAKIDAWQAQKKQIEGKNAKILKIAESIVKEMP